MYGFGSLFVRTHIHMGIPPTHGMIVTGLARNHIHYGVRPQPMCCGARLHAHYRIGFGMMYSARFQLRSFFSHGSSPPFTLLGWLFGAGAMARKPTRFGTEVRNILSSVPWVPFSARARMAVGRPPPLLHHPHRRQLVDALAPRFGGAASYRVQHT